MRILSTELPQHVGNQIMISGWVHSIRQLGHLAFVHLRDRSGIVQIVLEGELATLALTPESVITVHGQVVQSKYGAELHGTQVEVLSPAQAPLPIEVNKKEISASLDTILNHRALALRNPKVHATFTIQSVLAGAFRDFFSARGFTQIFTPKIVASGTEGGSNLFAIQYFEKQAYLAQSPQFYKQMMVGAGYERVFEIAPVYRAEEHNTSRHLNEYTSLDVEMGFIRSFEELMDLETELLQYLFHRVVETCPEELALLGTEVPVIGQIPRLTVQQAQQILLEQYSKTSPEGDLDPEGERLICQYYADQGKPALVFLTHYPREVRPMYAMPASDHPALTASFDLLFNGLEITTGGQRIHRLEMLEESMRNRSLNLEAFADYLNLFRYGMPPHGGFAIGLERLTARLLGHNNVREATAFPRDRNRLTP